jgi:hypothetical protein
MNAVEAGRKGGKSKAAAKLAAIKRNGFQRVKPEPVPQQRRAPILIAATKEKNSGKNQ